jgi:hypothetical protein
MSIMSSSSVGGVCSLSKTLAPGFLRPGPGFMVPALAPLGSSAMDVSEMADLGMVKLLREGLWEGLFSRLMENVGVVGLRDSGD